MMILHRSKFKAKSGSVTNNLQAISTKGHLEIKQTRNNVFMRQQKKNNCTNTVQQGEKQTPTLNATYEIYGLN
jgi:hypothetical protein